MAWSFSKLCELFIIVLWSPISELLEYMDSTRSLRTKEPTWVHVGRTVRVGQSSNRVERRLEWRHTAAAAEWAFKTPTIYFSRKDRKRLADGQTDGLEGDVRSRPCHRQMSPVGQSVGFGKGSDTVVVGRQSTVDHRVNPDRRSTIGRRQAAGPTWRTATVRCVRFTRRTFIRSFFDGCMNHPSMSRENGCRRRMKPNRPWISRSIYYVTLVVVRGLLLFVHWTKAVSVCT